MATYFGEILEPQSRSFVTDGEESSINDRYSVEVENEINRPTEKTQTYECLVITSGEILSDFAAAFLISNDAKILQKYNIVPKPTDCDKYCKKKITSTLYELNKNKLLFVCGRLPHPYFSHDLVIKLKPWIETAHHTIILTSDNITNFKPKGALDPFIRSLHTSNCDLTVHAPNLELPNTITGLSAAVISWCQANKKSALVYTIFVESPYLDSVTAEPLLQLLKTAKFLEALISPNNEKLKNIVNNAQLQYSNLYL